VIFTLDLSYICLMSSQFAEMVKSKAILAVFSRLGEENLAMLKYNLAKDYRINWDDDNTFTLEELQIALQRIMGGYGASLLLSEIHEEMRALTN
jgi:hypothetical protein